MLFIMTLAAILLGTSLLIVASSLFIRSFLHASDWESRELATGTAGLAGLVAVFFMVILVITALVNYIAF
jgi:hypothetical protein